MNTSLSWMKAYVPDLDVTPQEFTDAMTLSGSKVEGFTKLDADLEKIIIGQIEKIERHPDADKLIVCQVKIGEGETIQIVTGAPNVKEGDKVPVVLDGFISAVAALSACRLAPAAGAGMIASHCSGEPGARRVLDALGLAPVMTAGFCLGEGTGAVALLPLLDMAAAVYREMSTFGEIAVEAYRPLV